MTPSAMIYWARPAVLAAARRSGCRAEFRTRFVRPGLLGSGRGFSVGFLRGSQEVGGIREFWPFETEPTPEALVECVETDLRELERVGVLTPRVPEAW